ncbi:MAG: glycoside hydrolase family 1 protein [bacterium]
MKTEKQNQTFPENFFWGAATSSHQVEGDNFNDWSEWENSQERRRQLEKSGMIKKYGLENFISGVACDHYNRYEEDFDIAEKLGHNAHRFSIEWSRVEPEEGKFNQEEIEHYKKAVKVLRERGMEPFITLWHFTLPIWLAEKGGWLCEKSPFYFARYAEKVVSQLGDDVKFWITINEPVVYSMMTYLSGQWPSQKKSVKKYLKALKNLAQAHIEAYKKIHGLRRGGVFFSSPLGGATIPLSLPLDKGEVGGGIQVGIAKNNTYFSRRFWWCPFEWGIAKFLKYFKNDWFLEQIKDYQDFIGLNYYREVMIDPFVIIPPFLKGDKGGFSSNFSPLERGVLNDMLWRICPEGIYHCLKDLKKYEKPIFITENGIPDSKDEKRAKFIEDHIFWAGKAIQEGIDLRGYFYWSLLDNFEWAHGFWPKFGLVEIDYNTLERKIRPSAWRYKEIIEKNL